MSASEWQPIETVPVNGPVLLWNGTEVLYGVRDRDGDWDIFGYRWPAPFQRLGFTHWRHLPYPPPA